MRTYSIVIIIVFFLTTQSLEAMKGMHRAPLACTWPPRLLITHEASSLVAKRLQDHGISMHSFIASQLDSARKTMLTQLQQRAQLTDDDIKNIQSMVHLIQAYDAKAAQTSFLYREDDHQQEMHEHLPMVKPIAQLCKVMTDFEITYDPELPQETYYTRDLHHMVFDVDGVLILSRPENNLYPQSLLVIGPCWYNYDNWTQDGALARQIGGHILMEHASERYLFKEVMKKRKVATHDVRASLVLLQQLHALEADLLPASHTSSLAHCVLSWLKAQRNKPGMYHREERIKNVQTVRDILEHLEKHT